MNEPEKLLGKVNALNHIVMHLMALEVSRDDNPYEAAGLLQMRMLMAAQVKLKQTKDKRKREIMGHMVAELNAIYCELFRYFEQERQWSDMNSDK
ncbi:hypothetical protein [Ponticaulis koreensis]|uniref:hypothetical protein n=1 Tax=Ponticaulis koreensis TaxID=1123045 RepID=UPI0003B68B9F|nr:hypothetical protein [Ponticaulis koreensis]